MLFKRSLYVTIRDFWRTLAGLEENHKPTKIIYPLVIEKSNRNPNLIEECQNPQSRDVNESKTWWCYQSEDISEAMRRYSAYYLSFILLFQVVDKCHPHIDEQSSNETFHGSWWTDWSASTEKFFVFVSAPSTDRHTN